ncbi:MAG: putative cytokinetic ring protein SteA [Actinomycetota bacterium]|nr:hypothetical protein [Actinomycetota bacterium]
MALRIRRRRGGNGSLHGIARVDRKTKDLLLRLRPGEVAVIDHKDLDLVSAEGLVERGARAVVNASSSITGRYPNAGPMVLARAGIPLLDCVGEDLLERITEGERIRIDGNTLYRDDGELIGNGLRLEGQELEHLVSAATAEIPGEIERFVQNTMEYLSNERALILEGAGLPDLDTTIEGRHVLVVVRGPDYRRDLQTLRAYISDLRPILIAVDGAADAMLEEGLRPDLIVGDMDSISTHALTCGAEIVVHAYPDGHAPGLERVDGLGLPAKILRSAGTSEDIALLLAYENQADLIVAVGTHDNLAEFLDKGRAGMASTFLVRLKVGPKLVDAKGVNRLYRTQVRRSDLIMLVVAALVAWLVVVAISDPIQLWFKDIWLGLKGLVHDLKHLF